MPYTYKDAVIAKLAGAKDSYPGLDAEGYIKALQGAITYDTTSYADVSKMKGEEFKGLHKHFEKSFPLVHQHMTKEVVNDWSLLFFWKGSDPTLKPMLMMSHIDTVPVIPGTEGDWTYGCRSGEFAEGMIWGRGACDTKSQVVAELAACEYLLSKGFSPKRGLYLCFGHDEETMNPYGSKAIADLLASRGVELEFVVDEGGGFIDAEKYGAPGAMIAQVSVFEKGYADISVTATSKGGHSSKPGKHTSLGKVCAAVAAIEKAQFAPALWPPVAKFFKDIAKYITEEPLKSLVAGINQNPQALADYLYENDDLAPLVHTTTAPTMLEGGSPAPNVLTQTVTATINFRTAPSDSTADVLAHCIKAVNDPDVTCKLVRGMEPSKISGYTTYGFKAVEKMVAKFYPSAATVPFIVTGGTDCQYFDGICGTCMRFRPIYDCHIKSNAHTTDEKCSADAFVHCIKAFVWLIENVQEQ